MNLDIIETQLCRLLNSSSKRETPFALIERVASVLAGVEGQYGKSQHEINRIKKEFERIITMNLFWPSGRILNNAGSLQGSLASCFVLPLEDDFDSIFETLHIAARCHKAGGGTGFDFSRLRERNARISTSEAAGSCGPIEWMKLFNAETIAVMSGGKMRGANLATLNVCHPDIIEFIHSKRRIGDLANFNISVSVDNNFMMQLEQNGNIQLTSPYDGRIKKTIPATLIWNEIVEQAWLTGDPGLLFVDTINSKNCLQKHLGPITATNPCGEQTLYSFEASNLGSINLSSFYDKNTKDIKWNQLEDTIAWAMRMLDNAIDASAYPDKRIAEMVKRNRRLGLGVMGYADLLIKLNLQYDSDKALEFCEKLASFIHATAWMTSEFLAKEKGGFLNNKFSNLEKIVRNCAITSIAPTGTIAMIAECSYGIEPRFAPAYTKNVIKDKGVIHYDDDLCSELEYELRISKTQIVNLLMEKTLKDLNLPSNIIQKYRYAHEIDGYWHVATQAIWQKYIDNGISKTVNLPSTATLDNVSNIYMQAWKMGCKGISVYRANSRSTDIITTLPETIIQSKQLAKL